MLTHSKKEAICERKVMGKRFREACIFFSVFSSAQERGPAVQGLSKAPPFSGLSTPHQGFLWMENYGLQALNFLEKESPALHGILGERAF